MRQILLSHVVNREIDRTKSQTQAGIGHSAPAHLYFDWMQRKRTKQVNAIMANGTARARGAEQKNLLELQALAEQARHC